MASIKGFKDTSPSRLGDDHFSPKFVEFSPKFFGFQVALNLSQISRSPSHSTRKTAIPDTRWKKWFIWFGKAKLDRNVSICQINVIIRWILLMTYLSRLSREEGIGISWCMSEGEDWKLSLGDFVGNVEATSLLRRLDQLRRSARPSDFGLTA